MFHPIVEIRAGVGVWRGWFMIHDGAVAGVEQDWDFGCTRDGTRLVRLVRLEYGGFLLGSLLIFGDPG